MAKYNKKTPWDELKKRKWTIECDEEKLRLIADFVENVTRFLCGQPQMMSCLASFENGNDVGEFMLRHITPMLNPELKGASYGWSGGRCPNDYQRKSIAQGYATYKSILNGLANEYDWNNVHSGTILTCPEGGPLMKVRPVIDEPEIKEMWTATDKEGKQYIYNSKPVRRKWANGEMWEPSEGGAWYNEDFSAFMIKALGLPTLTWDDEPYRFQILTERKSDDAENNV